MRTVDEIMKQQSGNDTLEELLDVHIRESIAMAEEIRTAVGSMDPVKGRHLEHAIARLEEALHWHNAKPNGIKPKPNQ